MKTLATIGALALMTMTAAQAEPGNPRDGVFAQGAGMSNAFEIAEARIVLQDSTDPALRRFARQMIHDHSIAQARLNRAGAGAGVQTAFIFDKGRQSLVNSLGLLEGPALGSRYLADQVESHASAADNLADYAATGTDPALRAFARQTLPDVLHHQRMLEQMTGEPAPI